MAIVREVTLSAFAQGFIVVGFALKVASEKNFYSEQCGVVKLSKLHVMRVM
ncbi:hypothetical protein D3C76_1037690 [compost metagenome]